MRIDAYNKISQMYETHKATKVANKGKVSKKDKLEISNTGRDIQIAKEGLKKTSDIRQDKVNDIIKRMESGTYNVSAKEVADKIVDKYFDKSI